MPNCRGCGERVIFAHNPATGKMLILDASPLTGVSDPRVSEHPNTTVFGLVPSGGSPLNNPTAINEGPARYAFNPLLQAEVDDRYISHFVTCPNRDDFRQGKHRGA